MVTAITGPPGSGKTTAEYVKHIAIARQQQPSLLDGVRKYWLCSVRETYRQHWEAEIPAWFTIIPKDTGISNGSVGGPFHHEINFVEGGVPIKFIVDFLAIGDNRAEDVMRGYQPTSFKLGEADLLSKEVFTEASGRWGRYPPMREGGPSWYGMTMDFNAPQITSWAYDLLYRNVPDGFRLFRQPSGFSPDAENLQNLPGGAEYYRKLALGKPDWWIRRMIMGIPGFSRAGKPVYPEFNDALHVPGHDLDPIEGLPLIVGMDAGMSPAAVFDQVMPNGQSRTLAELVSDPGTGAIRFAETMLVLLKELFPDHLARQRRGHKAIRGWADPSAQYGVDRKMGEASWIDIVEKIVGFPIYPAATNAPIRRWEAVRFPLSRLIDGQPGYLLNPRCIVTREGFNSGYHFKETRAGGVVRDVEEVEKNRYSHVHDAKQYAAMGGGFDMEVMANRDARSAQGYQTMAINEDHPHGEYIGRGGQPGRRQLRAISEE